MFNHGHSLPRALLMSAIFLGTVGGLSLRGYSQDMGATTQPHEADPHEDNAPVAKPSGTAAKPKASAKTLRLVQPWSKVENLSDEQRQKLFDIHAEIVAKQKALDAEEEERCNAVLTDAQKAQLAETLDTDKAAKKAKTAEAKKDAKKDDKKD